MTWAFVAEYHNTNKTSGAAVIATASASVGDILLVGVVADTTNNGIDVFGASSISDGSNTYTLLEKNSSTAISGGPGVALYYCTVTSALSNAAVTYTPATAITAKAISVNRFSSGGSNTESGTVMLITNNANTTTWTGTHASPASGDLVFGVLATENDITGSFVGDSDTTNGSWSTAIVQGTTGGANSTNETIIVQYKIVTAAGSQTWNGTTTNSRNHGILVSLQPAFVPPSSAPLIVQQQAWMTSTW